MKRNLLQILIVILFFILLVGVSDSVSEAGTVEEMEVTETENKIANTTEIVEGTAVQILYKKRAYDDWGLMWEREYDVNGNKIGYSSSKYAETWEYDVNGNLIKNVKYQGEKRVVTAEAEYKYDVNGNLIEEKYYDTRYKGWYKYEYDSEGKLIQQLSVNEDGIESVQETYEYDSYGNLIEHIFSWGRREYEYDSNHVLLKKTRYDSEGNLATISTYDMNGNEIQLITYNDETWDNDGTIRWISEYFYDEAGRLLEEKTNWGNGVLYCWFKYEYDEAGNKIKAEESLGYRNDRWEYEYREDGKLIEERCYSDLNRDEITLWAWYKYEYDEKGNLTTVRVWRIETEEWLYDEQYEYNEEGNLLKEVYYDKQGKVNHWIENEYITIIIPD